MTRRSWRSTPSRIARPAAVLSSPRRPSRCWRGPRGSWCANPRHSRPPPSRRPSRGSPLNSMIVVGYGQILPQAVLDIPVLGCINVHASLLPRWRGAAPIAAAILSGDAETGVTLMRMTMGLDTGPILHQIRCPIAAGDTAGDLHERLADLGKQALAEALPAVLAGQLDERPQDEALATYAPKIERAQAQLDWHRPAVELARRVRAFNPRPVAFGEVAGIELPGLRGRGRAHPDGPPPRIGLGLRRGTGCGHLRGSLAAPARPGARPPRPRRRRVPARPSGDRPCLGRSIPLQPPMRSVRCLGALATGSGETCRLAGISRTGTPPWPPIRSAGRLGTLATAGGERCGLGMARSHAPRPRASWRP